MKSIGFGMVELRLDFGPGYQLYCSHDGESLIVLFDGGAKKGQQADIAAAQVL